VRALVGEYPLPPNCDGVRATAGALDQFVAALETAIDKKVELTLDFLARESWDLFVQVFTEAHCAGHQCWHLHDATHPAHDPEVARAVGDPLERVYRRIDRAVAAIAAAAGDGARILVICAHGMGPYRGAPFLLAEILSRLGVTARPPTRPQNLRDRALEAARPAWTLLPPAVRRAVNALAPRNGGAIDGLGIDPSTSRCFAIPNGSPVGGIRLNLLGREPRGVLRPGADAEAFCETLETALRTIIDERTGGPLVARVQRTDALYRGPRRNALPDLLVEWSEKTTGTAAISGGRGASVRATSPEIGTVEGENRYGRTGEHVPTGMFICTGSGIAAARRREPVSIMDFHPTICAWLDAAAGDVDGAVIRELAPGHAAARE